MVAASTMNLIPVEYVIDDKDWSVHISARRNSEGQVKWVVEELRSVMDKHTGKFEYEPMPSHRTEEFIDRTRFESVEEAYLAYMGFYGDKNGTE